jgi:hypothetical protein
MRSIPQRSYRTVSKSPLRVDTVRASRDGHEFHEAWAARMSLRLVMQLDGLVGIAVEGLAPADQSTASNETVEIADLVFYYGKEATFKKSRVVAFTQAKYSISKAEIPFRAADAAETIQKFAVTYQEHQKLYGAKGVSSKLEFELVTNRPLAVEFGKAITGIATGRQLKGAAAKQANQFKKACGLKNRHLSEFARKFSITGSAGSLRENKQNISRVIADWSAVQDSMALLRLGELRALVRDKAGSISQGRNLIKRIDVLAALQLSSEKDLLPFPSRFPKVGPVVPREQLADTLNLIRDLKKPLLIHAAGGTGKTVFLQSLASRLSADHKCVLFDCFDGGVYRAPEDGRHRPSRGLIHIVNSLACSALCDPLLPLNVNTEALISTFRRRLNQCVATLQTSSPGKQLVLIIDAIDNAAKQAEDKKEDSFPKVLLESLEITGQIKGVKIIVSCRSHRRKQAKGDVECEEIELRPFNRTETEKYLRDRISNVSAGQIHVAQSRSDGNPRILDHLARERGLLEPSEINKPITLDQLLKDRIKSALGEALSRGYKKQEINSFLAGLSVLPPPVPVTEYADSHRMDVSAVESFASDLAPLLERSKHGLTFRDEPTETYIRENYAADNKALRSLARNLLKNQDKSVYAANALPGLLDTLDDGKSLFELAFNDSLPRSITSTVGKQKIRYSRIKAAVLHAARKGNYNYLVRLLVELSTVASINQRGTDYLVDNPELAVLSQDADAVRRLVEDRSHWPGTKHARIAIAMALSQDPSEALRHAITANDWFQHFYGQDDKFKEQRPGPSPLDIAAIPFCLIAVNRSKDAARFIGKYYSWYSFQVSEHLFRLLSVSQALGSFQSANISNFLNALESEIGVIAGALSFWELADADRHKLVKKLAVASGEKQTVEKIRDDLDRSHEYRLRDGLLKSTTLAIYSGLKEEAKSIAKAIPLSSINLYVFFDRFGTRDAFPFVAGAVMESAAKNEPLMFKALLPQELQQAGAKVKSGLSLEEFRKALKEELAKQHELEIKLPKEKRSSHFHRKDEAEKFIDQQLAPLHRMATAFLTTLSKDPENRKHGLTGLIEVWEQLRRKPDRYPEPVDHLFNNLGRQLLEFSLWTGCVLEKESVLLLLQKLTADRWLSDTSLVEIVLMLAKHPDLQDSAGATAVSAKARIEGGDDVSSRATMFSRLAKAILPASIEEAKLYFRNGLEQMDAIGSGDYQFTNELLAFAGTLRGKELKPSDFHTLTNLCELNLTSEEEKFPWFDFGRGLSRISGCRGLAKLGRWHERRKVSLRYSLLPYLYALLDQDKIDPAIALGLLRLSDPAELRVCGTSDLAKLLEKKDYPNRQELLTELIKQFEENNPSSGMASNVQGLSEVAARVLGSSSDMSRRLAEAAPHYDKLREEQNARSNSHNRSFSNLAFARKQKKEKKQNEVFIKKILDSTDSCDQASLSKAVASFAGSVNAFDLKKQLLARSKERVKYSDRPKHVEAVARLENVTLFAKLDALKACKSEWANSSQAVKSAFNKLGTTVIQIHADDFIHQDYFHGSYFKEVAELCDVDFQDLILELIKTFAAPNYDLPPSIWLELASLISARTNVGEGQGALTRLLRGGAAKLSATVRDGEWKQGLYPTDNETNIAAGLIWLMLGSASVLDRWRAAHAVRSLARFDKWRVIDSLVSKYSARDAAPFQATELPFYFFHARLWLLIALHRLSIDYPQQISHYRKLLQSIALDSSEPHILLRHFAAQALLNCYKKGFLKLSTQMRQALSGIDNSPFEPVKVEEYKTGSFYTGRPESHPEPENDFSLEYDFSKYTIDRVSRLFDESRWVMEDKITAWVRQYDKSVKGMYESGGRESNHRENQHGINSKQQSYGYQLGWHALYVVTGQLLLTKRVVIGPYDYDAPWPEWLDGQVLSRRDGLWLSDGMDRPPLDTQVNLLDEERHAAITSDEETMLRLVRFGDNGLDDVVLAGNWTSPDGISVKITTALVAPENAKDAATKLAKADGFSAWLPCVGDCDQFDDKPEPKTLPWVVSPSRETAIDENDPLGSGVAINRTRFASEIISLGNLRPTDAFERAWVDSNGQIVCRSEAWGSSETNYEGESFTGKRMVCSRDFLKTVLDNRKMDLLLLVVLQKYEKGYGGEESKFWHSTAIVHITKSLKQDFYPGLASKEHKSIRRR